jgi:hypothetical protein
MVEIRVGVGGASGAQGLVRRLVGAFDGPSVSFDGTRQEVRVRSEGESRAVVQVFDAVEAWLAEDRVDSAELSIGSRSYTMIRPPPIASGV